MEKREKKKYEKPEVTRVALDPSTAVLGVSCKSTGVAFGPAVPTDCGGGSPCSALGS
ncbi:MAG: hypothetical protein JRJ26_16755 [Deltaproteobacteria bacterium]|nr:hypothetical protein [Deltaproteobacteria bacterium]